MKNEIYSGDEVICVSKDFEPDIHYGQEYIVLDTITLNGYKFIDVGKIDMIYPKSIFVLKKRYKNSLKQINEMLSETGIKQFDY